MKCRICAAQLGSPDYAAAAPALTDSGRLLDMQTEVYVCEACGLAQSPDIPNVTHFYAHEYKISLQAADHDQLVSLSDGRSMFRTDLQAELVLGLAAPPRGAAVLDFGCGNASTLRKMTDARPDLRPHVFDVSDDYRASWAEWVAAGQCATHVVPDAWRANFDLVMCHFVLEHVVDVPAVLANLRMLLAPRGVLFLSVPNALANPGDLLVADHLSHFTRGSLANALASAGLEVADINSASFPGALLSVCRARGATRDHAAIVLDPEAPALRQAASGWATIESRVREAARVNRGAPAAIYGAGFYGSVIRTLLGPQVGLCCFIDANPHLQGSTHMGLPVVAPADTPSGIRLVYAGLNPLKARAILEDQPHMKGRTIVWLQ